MPIIVPATAPEIRRAAAILRAGGIVAFPTETVYGLGANALDAEAVGKIFAAKGRPATNPIIVHIADMRQFELVAIVSDEAAALAAHFWPGPLTLVLPKTGEVPDIVTASGPTVGVRMPRHPVALQLIREADLPIAAPSANRSERISPTRAQHVANSLGRAVDLILDGGSCAVGIESSVLDLASDPPRILRPGIIGAAEIEEVLGRQLAQPGESQGISRSPGRRPRHYAPRHPVQILNADVIESAAQAQEYVFLVYSDQAATATADAVRIVLPADPSGYATGLYHALHTLDSTPTAQSIIVEEPPPNPEWAAIRDRLRRAAAAG